MKALLVIDFQDKFLKQRDFNELKKKVYDLIDYFKAKSHEVIVVEHLNDFENPEHNPLDTYVESQGDIFYAKLQPSVFKNSDLINYLKLKEIEEVFIAGLNMEYCILFNAIAAYEHGFKVTVVEDACSTVNNAETYEMPGLDIIDFVGSVLNWSNVVKVLTVDEVINENESI
ncbi:cysteine hydrolase family protein [Macrococcus sp. DPC7161]|uniref:cysteine hydrolase family protein n=1 Tax=Macrococcus sp. DPC7161 TaxID=2507060 RepID=UPI00100A58C0|nr:isochorismatase family cysteine hydrolase [Macrococcus sp. DPC7161]RXK19174.1 cysteine hydrolase [Macrococcus sp. DPC7161]